MISERVGELTLGGPSKVSVVVPGVGRPRQSQALDNPELMEFIANAVESNEELASTCRTKALMAST